MLGKLRYALKCAARMDWKELFRTVNTVHGITGGNRLSILKDVISCGLRYGAGFNDYLLCEFYNLTAEQRATYVTRQVNHTLVSLLNDRDYYHFFDNKSEFYRTFADYLGREWLDFSTASLEDFEHFLEGREQIIAKPESESGGKGVEKLSIGDYPSVSALYEELQKKEIGVVEEVLRQHPELDRLNPGSINTLRLVTIVKDGEPHLVYAHIRIGNSDRPVDNLHSGGMFAPIDPDTGRVQYPAYDKARNTYTHHPRTGVEIQGFVIPCWPEAKALCLKAALTVPQMRYVGWDVAITPNGPVFVEGNNFPGYDILQMPPHLPPDKTGMLPRFREFVDI